MWFPPGVKKLWRKTSPDSWLKDRSLLEEIVFTFNEEEELHVDEFKTSINARRNAVGELISTSVGRETELLKTCQAQRTTLREAYHTRQASREKDAEALLKRIADEANHEERVHKERFEVSQARRREMAEAGMKGLQSYLEKRAEARAENSRRYQAHELAAMEKCEADLEKYLQEFEEENGSHRDKESNNGDPQIPSFSEPELPLSDSVAKALLPRKPERMVSFGSVATNIYAGDSPPMQVNRPDVPTDVVGTLPAFASPPGSPIPQEVLEERRNGKVRDPNPTPPITMPNSRAVSPQPSSTFPVLPISAEEADPATQAKLLKNYEHLKKRQGVVDFSEWQKHRTDANGAGPSGRIPSPPAECGSTIPHHPSTERLAEQKQTYRESELTYITTASRPISSLVNSPSFQWITPPGMPTSAPVVSSLKSGSTPTSDNATLRAQDTQPTQALAVGARSQNPRFISPMDSQPELLHSVIQQALLDDASKSGARACVPRSDSLVLEEASLARASPPIASLLATAHAPAPNQNNDIPVANESAPPPATTLGPADSGPQATGAVELPAMAEPIAMPQVTLQASALEDTNPTITRPNVGDTMCSPAPEQTGTCQPGVRVEDPSLPSEAETLSKSLKLPPPYAEAVYAVWLESKKRKSVHGIPCISVDGLLRGLEQAARKARTTRHSDFHQEELSSDHLVNERYDYPGTLLSWQSELFDEMRAALCGDFRNRLAVVTAQAHNIESRPGQLTHLLEVTNRNADSELVSQIHLGLEMERTEARRIDQSAWRLFTRCKNNLRKRFSIPEALDDTPEERPNLGSGHEEEPRMINARNPSQQSDEHHRTAPSCRGSSWDRYPSWYSWEPPSASSRDARLDAPPAPLRMSYPPPPRSPPHSQDTNIPLVWHTEPVKSAFHRRLLCRKFKKLMAKLQAAERVLIESRHRIFLAHQERRSTLLMHADTAAQTHVSRVCTMWEGTMQAAEEARDDTYRVQLSNIAGNALRNKYEFGRAFTQLEKKIVESGVERDAECLENVVDMCDRIERKVDDGYRTRVEGMREHTGWLYEQIVADYRGNASRSLLEDGSDLDEE